MKTFTPRRLGTMLGAAVLVSAIAGFTGVLVTTSEVRAQDADWGAYLFAENCAICHGTQASGRMGPPLNMIPPEIASLPPEAVAGQLTGLIRNGIPGRMPRFVPNQISDEDVPHLVAYLFSVNQSLPSPSLYEALAPVPSTIQGRTFFPETGHSIGGEFRDFFMRYGGQPFFGQPLSEEYWGVSPDTGQTLRMQLFEKARMELHPEAPVPDQRVQLSRLGAEDLQLRTHFLED